jgi:hypothetical protein
MNKIKFSILKYIDYKMDKKINVILLIGVLILLYYCLKKNKNEKNIENLNTDKIFIQPDIKSEQVVFNYESETEKESNMIKQFLIEQEEGAHIYPKYSNSWIDKLDENDNPIYNSKKNSNDFLIEPKTRQSWEFNKNKFENPDGIINSNDNFNGKTIKEIYDNAFVNYKNLIPEKSYWENNERTEEGASNLSYYKKDNWYYDNEKPENGGEIMKGLSGSDPLIFNSNHATF